MKRLAIGVAAVGILLAGCGSAPESSSTGAPLNDDPMYGTALTEFYAESESEQAGMCTLYDRSPDSFDEAFLSTVKDGEDTERQLVAWRQVMEDECSGVTAPNTDTPGPETDTSGDVQYALAMSAWVSQEKVDQDVMCSLYAADEAAFDEKFLEWTDGDGELLEPMKRVMDDEC